MSIEQAMDEYDRRIVVLLKEEEKNGISNTPIADAYSRYITSK